MRNEGVMSKIVKISPTMAKCYWQKTSHLRGNTRVQSLPNSLQFDPQVRNFKEDGNFSYNVQLSDSQEFPRSSWNLSRKMTLRQGKTLRQLLFAGLYLTGPNSTSCKICDTLKKTSQVFQGHQDHRKPTSVATSTVRGKINESKESVLEIRRVFPLGGPPSRIDSSQLAMSWSESLEH